MLNASEMWPWWIVPWYFGLKFLYFVSYPVAVWPFHATCHSDLWGNEPPYSCLSYYCPRVTEEQLSWWPQCVQWKREHPQLKP